MLYYEVSDNVYGNQHLQMIKAFRLSYQMYDEATGECIRSIGLKEAKEYCDAIRDKGSISLELDGYTAQRLLDNGFVLDGKTSSLTIPSYDRRKLVKVHRLHTRDEKLPTIKDLRYALDLGLKEAKEHIDTMYGRKDWATGEHIGGQRYFEVRINEAEYNKLIQRGFTVVNWTAPNHFDDDLFTF